jgi:hypothetical protein
MAMAWTRQDVTTTPGPVAARIRNSTCCQFEDDPDGQMRSAAGRSPRPATGTRHHGPNRSATGRARTGCGAARQRHAARPGRDTGRRGMPEAGRVAKHADLCGAGPVHRPAHAAGSVRGRPPPPPLPPAIPQGRVSTHVRASSNSSRSRSTSCSAGWRSGRRRRSSSGTGPIASGCSDNEIVNGYTARGAARAARSLGMTSPAYSAIDSCATSKLSPPNWNMWFNCVKPTSPWR